MKNESLKKTTKKALRKTDVISRFFEWLIPIGFVSFLIWALYAVFGW